MKFDGGMAAQLCQYCAINFAEDTVPFLLYFNTIYHTFIMLSVSHLRGPI